MAVELLIADNFTLCPFELHAEAEQKSDVGAVGKPKSWFVGTSSLICFLKT